MPGSRRPPMRIAVDAMGGDHAPRTAVTGAYRAAVEEGVSLLLVGEEGVVRAELARLGDTAGLIEVVHAEESIGMDEPAITPLRKKRRSSLSVCAELVRDGTAEAFVSAGNTGAAMIAAKHLIGTVEGVDRPALAAVFPSATGHTVVLDVGANVDTKPEHLRQFAVMGHFYAQEVLRRARPRIGLLSIGEESAKGSEVVRETHGVLDRTGLHFVGNVEGGDFFSGAVDVVVCDGFVGNAVLKAAESMAGLMGAMLREEIERSTRARAGYALARPAFDAFRRRVDYAEYGAAPLLGLKGGCFIAHGRSDARAVKNAIRRAVEFCDADLHRKIRDKVGELHVRENEIEREVRH
jgi:glycerol-3-phosphate acyltransferase PlsX